MIAVIGMNKFLAGILIGGVLGIVDGATAWFTPAVRPAIMGILIGSSVKGMLVGIFCALVAMKVRNTATVIAAGAIAGLLLARGVAAIPQPNGDHYYFQIMLPGFVAGAIIGFLTQRLGAANPAQP